jgi:hypothetical protein
MELRPLGTSTPVRIANTFTIFANGNQASVTNDVVRRTIREPLQKPAALSVV